MSSVIYIVLLLLKWTTQCSALTLTSSSNIIGRNGTHNLTLTCSMNKQKGYLTDESLVEDVKIMRILKLEKGKWNSLIEMGWNWKSPIVSNGLEGSVSTDETGINHLQVTWPLATKEAAGKFICDVIGYTRTQEAFGQRSASVFIDVEAPLTLYQLFTMLQTSNKKLENVVGKTSTNEENLEKSQKTLDVLSNIFIEQWPQGKYALLQPESGCPADIGVIWKSGFRTHFTESHARNKDEVSSPAHMKKPFMWIEGSAKLMRQYFCSVNVQSTGRLWPAGSYCVNKYINCPLGFNQGNILWDDENAGNTNQFSGTTPSVEFNAYVTRIYYCCRNDSSAQTPIHLPQRKPFYLYRYGGICQAVAGMKVTPEYMFFDTDSSSQYNNFAPDGADSLPDVKLHLCYYEAA